jgi:hypothetical protein
MKYLFLALLFSTPDMSESLGNQLAIKAECSRIEHELPVYECDEYTDFDIFKMYFSSFVRSYSDIDQIIAWTDAGDNGYGTVIKYKDQQYLVVFNDLGNIFVISKAQEEV